MSPALGLLAGLDLINMAGVQDILTRDNPAVFAPEVDAQIRTEFTELVAGDAVTPPGWKRSATPRQRPRRQKRIRHRTR